MLAGATLPGWAARRERGILLVLEEELEVDFKDGLQEPHVGTLVQTDLVLPDVDEQDLAGGEGKEGALSLKVLVLAALTTVGTLDVHDEDVVGHLLAGALTALVLGHPDALGGLATLRFGHDSELGAKEIVEEGRLAGGLGAKDGDEVVVEACIGNVRHLEVVGDVCTVCAELWSVWVWCAPWARRRRIIVR